MLLVNIVVFCIFKTGGKISVYAHVSISLPTHCVYHDITVVRLHDIKQL